MHCRLIQTAEAMRPDERGLGGALQIQAEHEHFMRSLLHGQQCTRGMQVPLQRCPYDADTLSLNRSAAVRLLPCYNSMPLMQGQSSAAGHTGRCAADLPSAALQKQTLCSSNLMLLRSSEHTPVPSVPRPLLSFGA